MLGLPELNRHTFDAVGGDRTEVDQSETAKYHVTWELTNLRCEKADLVGGTAISKTRITSFFRIGSGFCENAEDMSNSL